MKATKSTKPAKAPRAGADLTTMALGLAIICIAGFVVIVGARKSPKAAEMPTMASASTTAPQAMPAKAPKKPAAVKAAVATSSAPAATPVAAVAAEPEPVTVTGCLERDDNTFRLKDTDVVTEAKGRSWKSGFLKKGAATIEVVDDSKRLKLADHVGKRVSVTGTLAYREMHGRSVKRVAASCSGD